jgi:hypothetical protein
MVRALTTAEVAPFPGPDQKASGMTHSTTPLTPQAAVHDTSPGMAYGGIKQSGPVREYSVDGALEGFTQHKSFTIAYRA